MCIYKAAGEGFHLAATVTETVSDACWYKLTWEFPVPQIRSAEFPTIDDPDPPPTDAATLLFALSLLIRNNVAICRLSHVGMKLILNP